MVRVVRQRVARTDQVLGVSAQRGGEGAEMQGEAMGRRELWSCKCFFAGPDFKSQQIMRSLEVGIGSWDGISAALGRWGWIVLMPV